MVCDYLSSDLACVKKRGLKFLTGRVLTSSPQQTIKTRYIA